MNLVALRTTLVDVLHRLRGSEPLVLLTKRETIVRLDEYVEEIEKYIGLPKCAGCGEAIKPHFLTGTMCYCFNRHSDQLRIVAYRITPPGYPCMGKWEDGDISPQTEAHVKAQGYTVEKAYAK